MLVFYCSLIPLGIYPIDSQEPPMDLPIWNIGTTLSPLFQHHILGYKAFGIYPYQTTCRSGYECPINSLDNGKIDAKEYHSRKKLKSIVQAISLPEGQEIPCHKVPRCVDCEHWSFTHESVPKKIIVLQGSKE